MTKHVTHRTRTGGFTLIELLVVVAIIALLMAILLPSLGKARDQAKTAVCLSNLKSLASAAHVYGAEFNGMVVPWAANKGTLSSDSYAGARPYWDYTIFRSFSGEFSESANVATSIQSKIFLCPAITIFNTNAAMTVPEWRNYNINAMISGTSTTTATTGATASVLPNRNREPYKFSGIMNPAQVNLFSERGQAWPLNDKTQLSGTVTTTSGLTSRRPLDLPEVPHATVGEGGYQSGNSKYARVSGIINSAMADGHAESFKWKRLIGNSDAEVPKNFTWTPDAD